MNEKTIFLLGSLLGAAAGALGTYFAMKDKVNKEVAKEVEKYHRDIRERGPKAPVKDPLVSPLDPSLRAHSSIDDGPVSLDNYRTDYAAMAPNYKKTLDDITMGDDPRPAPEDAVKFPIRIIDADEFNANDEADVTNLFWYPDENVLADEYNEEIEERYLLVGNCLEELIGRETFPVDEDGLLYVINEELNIIYAIAVVHGDRKGGISE